MMNPQFFVEVYNRRNYLTKLALDTALDPEFSAEQRLESFRLALSHWEPGSFEHDRLTRLYPELARGEVREPQAAFA